MFVHLLSQPNVYSAYSAQFYSLGLCLPLLGFCWLGSSLLGILHTSVQGWCCTFNSICFHSPKEQWTSPYLPNSFSYFGMHGRTVKFWNKNYLQSFHTLKNWMCLCMYLISVCWSHFVGAKSDTAALTRTCNTSTHKVGANSTQQVSLKCNIYSPPPPPPNQLWLILVNFSI